MTFNIKCNGQKYHLLRIRAYFSDLFWEIYERGYQPYKYNSFHVNYLFLNVKYIDTILSYILIFFVHFSYFLSHFLICLYVNSH
jgi:hypothetical protein